MRRRYAVAIRAMILGVVTAAALAGCSVQVTDLPLPGTSMSGDQYRVDVVFRSVLNLPDKAKVYLEGVEVGIVDAITLEDRFAVVTIAVRKGVQLSTKVRAKIKQSSLLGDLFVELSEPVERGTQELVDGDRIPVDQTDPADSVEGMLRSLSVFVGGAPVGDIVALVQELNAVMPGEDEIRSLAAAAKKNLDDLAESEPEISTILKAAEDISGTLAGNADRVDFLLRNGPPRVAGLADVLYGVIDLMASLAHFTGPITPLLAPITPDLHRLITILQPAAMAIANSDRSLAFNVEQVNALMRDKLIPFLSSPLNIAIHDGTKAGGDPRQRADRLIALMRGVGMVR